MNMKKSMWKFLVPVAALGLVFASCEKEDEEENEEELITTVKLTFTEVGGAGTVSNFTFKDLDGDGGNPPSMFQDIVLAPNKQYNVAVTLTNEAVSPAEDITGEISAEANDHQFYYEPSGANVTVSNLNTDGAGLPLGLTSSWTTTTVSNGTVKITLKHKPGIKAAGDPVTKGDTDIELNWITRVQ
jgi:hypothetical protein